MQPEEQREIEMKENEQNLREMWDTTTKHIDICKMRIPGEDREEQRKYLLKTQWKTLICTSKILSGLRVGAHTNTKWHHLSPGAVRRGKKNPRL